MTPVLRTSLIIATLMFSGSIITNAQSQKVNESLIVTTEWLATHLNDKSLVLLQVGEKDEFTAAHIPRAQFIQTADVSTPRGQGLSLEFPSVEQLKATFEKLGVSNNSRIVIYFSKDWITPSARIFLTLDYLGLGDRTSILDGGLPAWRAAGKPVTAEVVEPKKGTITPKLKSKVVVDAAWVKSNVSNPNVRILDARAPQFYSGAELGRMPRGGHIPSARNIPFSSLVESSDNKFKSPDTLRELFRQAEVTSKIQVATYCHIGQQASLLYFVARYLGYEAHVYDGLFEEWSNHPDWPVERKVEVKP